MDILISCSFYSRVSIQYFIVPEKKSGVASTYISDIAYDHVDAVSIERCTFVDVYREAKDTLNFLNFYSETKYSDGSYLKHG